MNANYIINAARRYLEAVENRSAWEKGVNAYADDMLDDLLDEYPEIVESGTRSDVEKALLNGAKNWSVYSWGGCSLIYDQDIAKQLCSPSEYRKTNGGERRPNSREEWLDVQARRVVSGQRATRLYAPLMARGTSRFDRQGTGGNYCKICRIYDVGGVKVLIICIILFPAMVLAELLKLNK